MDIQTSPEGYTAGFFKKDFSDVAAPDLDITVISSREKEEEIPTREGIFRTIGVKYGGFKGHLWWTMWVFGRKGEMSAEEST